MDLKPTAAGHPGSRLNENKIIAFRDRVLSSIGVRLIHAHNDNICDPTEADTIYTQFSKTSS